MNPKNYDVWFDYIHLEEAYGETDRVREIYEVRNLYLYLCCTVYLSAGVFRYGCLPLVPESVPHRPLSHSIASARSRICRPQQTSASGGATYICGSTMPSTRS